MYNCYAIDDEEYALEKISAYIDTHKDLVLLKTFNDPIKAFSYISENNNVDIIFMDIEMPEMNGIELAKRIRHKASKLVFSSAHSKYGYDAYKVDGNNFLLKPYSFADFEMVVDKLFSSNQFPHLNKEQAIILKDKHRFQHIKLKNADIFSIESKLHAIKISTSNGIIESNLGLTEIKQMLSSHPEFVQVHKSFIISTNHISAVERNQIRMMDNTLIPIGKKYKKSFDDLFFV